MGEGIQRLQFGISVGCLNTLLSVVMMQLMLLLLFAVATQNSGTSQTYTVSGREYILHVPKNYRGVDTPLVLAFHGLKETAETMEKDSGLSDYADTHDFLVAYPLGSGPEKNRSWDGGTCCGGSSDDVTFALAVIGDVANNAKVNTKKVYAVGMSNGGMFANRLGCEHPDKFAAIGMVASVGVANSCTPNKPVPLIHIHGTADSLIKFNGSVEPLDHQSIPDHIKFWVKHNKATAIVPPVDLSDSPMKVVQQTYANSTTTPPVEVVLVTVEGGGHLWPGRPVPARLSELEKLALGKTTDKVSANDLLWKFLSRYSR